MSNDTGVVKLGSVAAVATNEQGNAAAKSHVGADPQIHSNAQVWRLYQKPGDDGGDDYVVCPTGDVGNHRWDIAITAASEWTAGVVKPPCVIIKPTGGVPVIGPIDPVTMYLRNGAGRAKVKGFDKLRDQLASLDWKQHKVHWVARLPDDQWMIVEHS